MLSSRAKIAHQQRRHLSTGALVGVVPRVSPAVGHYRTSCPLFNVNPNSSSNGEPFASSSRHRCYSSGRGASGAAEQPAGGADDAAGAGGDQQLDSIKHLIKGPMTPLTIFATSPPPPPHPSRYRVPAAAPQAAALDFRLGFHYDQVKQIKQERFKEEMGVFKILYERPFLREYRNALAKKELQRKQAKAQARKEIKEKKRKGLLKSKRKTAFEVEQDRQRKLWLQALQYPYKVPELSVKAEELKRYFDFINTHSEKDIYDRIYPEFFGDIRENAENLVPVKDYPYVWTTFFDPENPNDYLDQAEAEDDVWESLNKTAEQQITDIIDEMDSEQERETRMTHWETDPGRFRGKWTPRDWPDEELELSHIKQRARNLRYLRDQLKKHGLMAEDESISRDELIKLEESEQPTAQEASQDETGEVGESQSDGLSQDGGATSTDLAGLGSKSNATSEQAHTTTPTASDAENSSNAPEQVDLASLLNAVLPTEHQNVLPAEASSESTPHVEAQQSVQEPEHHVDVAAWKASVAKFEKAVNSRVDAGEDEERVIDEELTKLADESELIVKEEEEQDELLADLDQSSIRVESSKQLAINSEEAMNRARAREARLHRLQEHVAVPFDKSQKNQIFASEPIPGRPAIEFIHSYSMDPDVAMGSLGRRDFLQRKVILKVHVPSLRLPPAVRQRLTALVGTRFDSRTGILKLVGDKHPNRHLNHKYLKLLMKELLNEAFLADSRYTPFSDLDIANPSSLRRKYTLPDHVKALFDGNKAGEWEYKMFTFSRYPAPQEATSNAARLQQRLASALS